MGTRSTIALEYADGTVDQVYCHWDGYLDHNGRILQEHYSDPFKLRNLMDLGDMSSLRAEIGVQHKFSPFDQVELSIDEFEKKHGGECTFYGRDRGESGTERKRFKDFADYVANHQYEEYEYILRCVNGKAVWFVSSFNTDGYMDLAQAFAKEQEMAE
jgi:hypothetical protein